MGKSMIKFAQFDENDLTPIVEWPAGEFGPKPAAIEINCYTDTVSACPTRYMLDEIPQDVWHRHCLEFHIPSTITGRALNRIFEDEEFRSLCERIIDGYGGIFNGKDVIAVYSKDAKAAMTELEQWLEANINEYVDCVEVVTAKAYVDYEPETLGITAETTDEWIEKEAEKICEELAADKWAIVGGVKALAQEMIRYRNSLKGDYEKTLEKP